MTRQEHLNWCKQRALEYCDQNDLDQALASMASDLTKHPETENHIGRELGFSLYFAGELNTVEKMRQWIKGFN